MKIRFEHNGTVFEYERCPVSESRFKALCAVAFAVLYVCLVIGVTALCGIYGLVAVVVLTFLVVLIKFSGF